MNDGYSQPWYRRLIRGTNEALWSLAIWTAYGINPWAGAATAGIKPLLNSLAYSTNSQQDDIRIFLESVKTDLEKLDYDSEALRLSYLTVYELLKMYGDKPIVDAVSINYKTYAKVVLAEGKKNGQVPFELEKPIQRMLEIFFSHAIKEHSMLSAFLDAGTIAQLADNLGSRLNVIETALLQLNIDKFTRVHKLLSRPWLAPKPTGLSLRTITARSQAIPYEEVTSYRDIRDWIQKLPDAGVFIRALIGPGGSGKSRTAIQLAGELARKNWIAGFWGRSINPNQLEPFFSTDNPYTRGATGLLLVIDYSEQRSDDLHSLFCALARIDALNWGRPVAILALGRTYPEALRELGREDYCSSCRHCDIERWQEDLCPSLRDGLKKKPVKLQKLTVEEAFKLFSSAYNALGDLTDRDFVLFTKERAWEIIRSGEAGSYPERPLPLIIAALLAVRGVLERPLAYERVDASCEKGGGGLLEQAYCFEVNHRWIPEIDKMFPGRQKYYTYRLERLISLSSLLVYLEREEAAILLEHLGITGVDREVMLDVAERLFPYEGKNRIAALEPDPIVELLVNKVGYENIQNDLFYILNYINSSRHHSVDAVVRFLHAYDVLTRMGARRAAQGLIDELKNSLGYYLNQISEISRSTTKINKLVLENPRLNEWFTQKDSQWISGLKR